MGENRVQQGPCETFCLNPHERPCARTERSRPLSRSRSSVVVLDTARDAHDGDEHRRRACGVHVQLECAPGDERLLDLEDAQLYLDLPCDRRGAAAITDHATGGYKAPVDAAAARKAQLHVIPSKRERDK